MIAQTSDALTLITPDSVAMISVQPALMAKSKSMQRLPLEVISAAGLEYIGIDPPWQSWNGSMLSRAFPSCARVFSNRSVHH